jgi:hypothetical protein
VGALPLPAGAFGDLEALLNPGPQPIPTGGAGLRRRSVSINQGSLLCLPAASRVQWSWRFWPLKAMPVPCQDGPGSGTRSSGTSRTRPRAKVPSMNAQQRMPSQPRDAPKQPASIQAAIGQHDDGPGRRSARRIRRSMRNHSRRQACLPLLPARSRPPIAHPRSTR